MHEENKRVRENYGQEEHERVVGKKTMTYVMSKEKRVSKVIDQVVYCDPRGFLLLLPDEILASILGLVLHTMCAEREYRDLRGMIDQATRDSRFDACSTAQRLQNRLIQNARFSPLQVQMVERKRSMFSRSCVRLEEGTRSRNGKGASRQESRVNYKRLVRVHLDDSIYGPSRVVVLCLRELYFDTFYKGSDLAKVENQIRPLFDQASTQNSEKFFLAPRESLVDISQAFKQIKEWDSSDALVRWLNSKAEWVKIVTWDLESELVVKVRWHHWAIEAVML